MDSIDVSSLKDALNGFVSSLGQTGSEASNSISHLGSSLSSKLPTSLANVLSFNRPPPPPPKSFMDYFCNFITERKAAVAFTLVSLASSVCLYSVYNGKFSNGKNRSKKQRKQRSRLARRASNGGRSEVVLLTGSPKEPLVWLLAQDLNIRGFIVYITASPSEEENVLNEHNEDIHLLRVSSYFDPVAVAEALSSLNKVLETPVSAFAGATPHFLSLAGIVIVPDLFYPSGPLEATPHNQLAQTVQSKIQMPLNILASGALELARNHASKLILITPVIIGSLSPAFHAAEAMVYGALSNLALSVSREVSSQRVPFVHLRLGSFDTRPVKTPPTVSSKHAFCASVVENVPQQDARERNRLQADILSWSDGIRQIYGGQYKASASLLQARTRGTNLRCLYNSLFDILISPSPPRVVRVGKGSFTYEKLTSWLPDGFISTLLEASERV